MGELGLGAYVGVAEVISQGTTRSTVILRNQLQVDLRAVGEPSYGTVRTILPTPKNHNIAIRRLGQGMGCVMTGGVQHVVPGFHNLVGAGHLVLHHRPHLLASVR